MAAQTSDSTYHASRIDSDHAAIAALTEINLDDLLASLGLEHLQHGRSLLRRLFRPPAQRLAEQVLTCDHLTGELGLQTASAWLLGQYVRRFVVHGQANVPPTGPLLVVSNHPGLYDAIALFAALSRPDLKIIAATKPFLALLPHVSSHLLTINEASNERMGAVRAATRHLRSGGAVLLFAGGKIEPDPAVLPGAITALGGWSESINLFGRLVPNVTVLPAVVSGVLSEVALRHPLTKLRRARGDQERLAATLQIVVPSLHRIPVRVDIGQPLDQQAFSRGSQSALVPAVLAATARLMEKAREQAGDRSQNGEVRSQKSEFGLQPPGSRLQPPASSQQ